MLWFPCWGCRCNTLLMMLLQPKEKPLLCVETLFGVILLLSLVARFPMPNRLPQPSAHVLSADIRHSGHDSEIDITELRVETFRGVMLNHIQMGHLSAGAAGKL